MTVEKTAIEGLYVVRWATHGDDRGFFRQTYQLGELTEALGYEPIFRQGNHARSAPGVLRGFHAEPWDKMVYVVRGRAVATILDQRPESDTFGDTLSFALGDPGDGRAERIRLFVSQGLGNSYCTYGDVDVEYCYDVTDEWSPGIDKLGVAWDDPDLAVTWPVDSPVLSDEDRANPRLRERFPDHARWLV